MSDMTRAVYARRVLLALGNVDLAHPLIAEGVHLDAINNAVNRLIRSNPDLFQDHQNRSMTIGPTIVGRNRISVPPHMLIIEKLRRTDEVVVTTTGDTALASNVITNCADTSEFEIGDFVSTSAGIERYQQITAITATTLTLDGPATANAVGVTIYVDPGDWSATQEIPVSESRASTIGLLDKENGDGSFPVLYDRKDGEDIVYWPTTDADSVCWFRAWGVTGEAALTTNGAMFTLDAYWDHSIVLLAANEVAELLDMPERAASLLAMANQRMESTINPLARERAMRPVRMRIGGMPR